MTEGGGRGGLGFRVGVLGAKARAEGLRRSTQPRSSQSHADTEHTPSDVSYPLVFLEVGLRV